MRYAVFCPCSVETKGLAWPDPDKVMHWFLWSWIHDKDDRAKCRHCGDILKVANKDEEKKYGHITNTEDARSTGAE